MHVRHCPNRPRLMKAAFTLVELLVTITVILVLAALSLAGFSKMRAAGDRVAATRSLAQLQMANTSYAADHNGAFVPCYTFDDKAGYGSCWLDNPEFFSCFKGEGAVYLANNRTDVSPPLNMLDPIVVRAKKKRYYDVCGSFGYNMMNLPGGNWGQQNANTGFHVCQLTAPERSAAFYSCTDAFAKYDGRFLWQGAGAVEGVTGDGKMALRHNHKALVAYYDGHVGEVSITDLKTIDQNGGKNNIFWKANAP